jgi:hypothetical protein
MRTIKKHIYLILFGSLVYIIIGFISGDIHNYNSTSHIVNDALSYVEAGKSLYGQFSFDSVRPVGISMFMGLPSMLCNEDICIVKMILFFQFILWIISGLLIFISLKNLVSEKLAFFISGVFYLTVSPLIISFFLLSETLFIFSLTLSLYFIIKYIEYRNPKSLLFFFLVLSFAVIVRPLLLYLWFLILIVLLIYIFKEKNQYVHKLMLLFPGIMIIVVQYIGVCLQHDIVAISDTKDKVLYQMTALSRSLRHGSLIEDEIKNALVEREEIMAEKNIDFRVAAKELFCKDLKHNKMSYIKSYLVSLKYNILGGNAQTSSSLVKQLSFVQNLLFSFLLLIGVIYLPVLLCYKRKVWSEKDIILLITIIFSLYLIFMGGLFYWQGDRYNIPAYSFILIAVALLGDKLNLYKVKIKE